MAEAVTPVKDVLEQGRSEKGVGNALNKPVTGPSAGRLLGQYNMLARLQALLPTAVSLKVGVDMTSPRAAAQSSVFPVSVSVPRFLKVRVVTWNMHDTLPKGNLEDLLGTVTPYVPYPEGESDKLRIPNMTMEDCHPYHLIVIAGQECPTVSGIPMGLTAGFRGKEKDKQKENAIATSLVDLHHPGDHGPTSGWSWILESWFCQGAGQKNKEDETSSASEVYNTQATAQRPLDPDYEHREDVLSGKQEGNDKKEKVKKRKSCVKKCKAGPYELLAKERLMGIYLAVFIYRDLKPLVRGLSKSAVTTGLIGGRLGNKGGVGISINLDGTALLFVNAHLAAHEERVMDRVANMAKIKSELQVDDYLRPDDPRIMAEDLTDRFDYTFVFGDLNFRLDITRRHADWLISRQAYDQALAFDQLRNLMAKGRAFVGFREGSINFPPTFKYDVFRSLKRDKSKLSKENSKGQAYYRRWRGQLSNLSLSRLEEQNDRTPGATNQSKSGDTGEGEVVSQERAANPNTDNEDSGSITSANVTTASSVQSRRTVDDGQGDVDVDDDYFARPLITGSTNESNLKRGVTVITRKQFITKAALKAKEKWVSLISTPKSDGRKSSRFVRKTTRARADSAAMSTNTMPQMGRPASGSSQVAFDEAKAVSAIELGQSIGGETKALHRAVSKKSAKSNKSSNVKADQDAADIDDRKGVYDSSSKQRVPSWCDRILWKSTVRPEPDLEEEVNDNRLGFGPRVLQFLQQSFRSRNRNSISQLPSPPSAESHRTVSLPPQPVQRPSTAPSGSSYNSLPSSSPSSTGIEKLPTYTEGESLGDLVYQGRWLRTKGRPTKLTKSKSVEPEMNVSKEDIEQRTGLRRGRSFSAQVPISRPIASTTEDHDNQSSDRTITSITTPHTAGSNAPFPRRFFPFLYRDSGPFNAASEMAENPQTSATFKHRKGDVVALSYKTLDDPAMRRLEGRSDHRPVIGSYALFI